MARTAQIAIFLFLSSLPASAARVELISELPARRFSDTAGGWSGASSLSADGRFLVFLSNAPNLVTGQVDTNLRSDVFLHDRVTGTTTLVSRTEDSPVTTAADGADSPVISADGRWIAYVQSGSGQAGAETQFGQVLLYDRLTETTTLVSRSRTGRGDGSSSLPALNADGRYLAYVSRATSLGDGLVDTNGYPDVFLYDRVARKTTLVSRAASSPTRAALGFSGYTRPALSADGRYVAFESGADDLIAGQGGAPAFDVFLFDRVTGRNSMVSHRNGSRTAGGNNSSSGPSLSANGEYVAYSSWATDLVAGQIDAGGEDRTADVFLFHRPSGATTLVSHASGSRARAGNGDSNTPFLSADGSWVLFGSEASNLAGVQQEINAADTSDVFLFERATGRLTLVSRSASPTTEDEASFPAGLSADGGLVLFHSSAANLATPAEDTFDDDVFLYDRRSRKTRLVSYAGETGNLAGNGHSAGGLLSADGNWIAFGSTSTNLARRTKDFNGSSDIFLYGRTTGVHSLVTRRDPALPGRTPLAYSEAGSVSRDGRFVTFTSSAADLVPGQRDTHEEEGGGDVFLRDRVLGTTVLVSRAATSPLQAGNASSFDPRISADGNFVVFISEATDLIAGGIDANQSEDVFLYDRATGTVTLVSHSAASSLMAGDWRSDFAQISGDGSVIAFSSASSDLVAGQTETHPSFSTSDVFLYRRDSGTVTLVSRAFGSATEAAGGSLTSMTPDGRFLVFMSGAHNLTPAPPPDPVNPEHNLYLFDQTTGAITLISRSVGVPHFPDGRTPSGPRISEDGRYVAFQSTDPDLVPGQNDEHRTKDVFLFDRTTGAMSLVSHAAGSPTDAVGIEGEPSLSADGRYVVFASYRRQPRDGSERRRGRRRLPVRPGFRDARMDKPAARSSGGLMGWLLWPGDQPQWPIHRLPLLGRHPFR